MQALVLGGTGFIGRRLVAHLLDNGCDVTVGTSGRTPNYFGDRVKTLTIDRFDEEAMKAAIPSEAHYDVLFDQLGYGPDDASKVVSAFAGRAGHYIYTSSAAVYQDSGRDMVESDFDAAEAEPKQGGLRELGYSEGKRSAEAYLARNAPFSFAAARFPIAIGPDDSTGRLQFHVQRVLDGGAIVVPAPCGKRNYAWVDDAGRFLCWLGLNRKEGAYNGASTRLIDANELVRRMGQVLGRTPKVTAEGEAANRSPYYVRGHGGVATAKAESEGFHFTPFDDWFPAVVKEAAATGGRPLNSMDYFQEKTG